MRFYNLIQPGVRIWKFLKWLSNQINWISTCKFFMTRTQTISDFAYVNIPNCFRVWIDFGVDFVVLGSEYLHRNLNHSTFLHQFLKSKLTRIWFLIFHLVHECGHPQTLFLYPSKILFPPKNVNQTVNQDMKALHWFLDFARNKRNIRWCNAVVSFIYIHKKRKWRNR